MPTENQIKAINEIMRSFDFQKVRDYMKSVKWTWMGSCSYLDEEDVPTVFALKRSARMLLEEVCVNNPESNYVCISSGGLLAIKHQQNALELYFVLEEGFAGIPSE